jgi:hypothetical protein
VHINTKSNRLLELQEEKVKLTKAAIEVEEEKLAIKKEILAEI